MTDRTTDVYLLTPKGIEEKARVTVNFFHRVEVEYEALKGEVENINTQEGIRPMRR